MAIQRHIQLLSIMPFVFCFFAANEIKRSLKRENYLICHVSGLTIETSSSKVKQIVAQSDSPQDTGWESHQSSLVHCPDFIFVDACKF